MWKVAYDDGSTEEFEDMTLKLVCTYVDDKKNVVKIERKNEAEGIERPNNFIGGYQPKGISYTPTNPPKGGSSQQDN